MSNYRITRTRIDYLTTDHGEIELPIPDISECADWNHKATILPDGRLLVSYLASDESYRDAEDVLGDSVPYVERNDVRASLSECVNCGQDEHAHPLAEDDWNDACPTFEPSDERKLYDLNRLMPVFVFGNGGQSGMDSRHDPDDWHSASGWLVLCDDFTQPTDWDDSLRIFNSARTEWNAWANGDIWGIVHAWYETDDLGETWHLLDDFESCWGYVDHEWAQTEMTFEHEHAVTHAPPVSAVQP